MFVAWLTRWRFAIFGLALAVMVGGFGLALGLPLRSDLSSLLPPSSRAVHDLGVLRKRARSFGTVLVMIEAPTPAQRLAAGTDLEAGLRALPADLIGTVTTDDNLAARYGWQHRFLFASLDDLRAARDALTAELAAAKLEANPLYVDFDDEDDDAPAGDVAASRTKLDALQRKLDDAERAASSTPLRLSADGTSQLFQLTVTFPASDIGKDRQVMGLVRGLGADLERRFPGVQVDYAGSVNISIFEHDSVIAGMALSAAITVLLVMLLLLTYYRAPLAVLAALFALMVGVAFTLAFTRLTIGHLNLLSAFLTAIIVGNGINPSLIVLSRVDDELRAGHAPDDAIGRALRGSLHGTLGASLTASVAYGALVVTDFRGFRHFGIIGGVGMIACWVTSYTVLPVALGWLGRRGRLRARPVPALGNLIGKLAPHRPRLALGVGAALTLAATAVTVVFLAGNPFQRDWRDLQADGTEIHAQHVVDARMNARFAKDTLSGHSFQLALAVDDASQVRGVVEALRAAEAKRPKGHELLVDIKSLDDLIPPEQPAKLALLAEIRALFDDPLMAQLDDAEAARLAKLRPPDDLRAIGIADVPPEISQAFIEQDGSVGRLIYVKGAPRFKTWDVYDRVSFARDVRRLELPPGVVIGGEPMVIAGIVETMERDTPIMVLVSLVGSILAVWLVVRLRRHGMITLACGLAGVILMIAACALVGLRVHFLDLIALPITIGIGIDYAINLTARDRGEPGLSPKSLLAGTGAAVVLCSLTTTIGYGSLLLSSNGGVRAFGLAAIIGEITCIAMALILAPALLARRR